MASKRALSPEENSRIARQIPEKVATEGDYDLIDEICAEDVVDISALGEVRGREEFKAQLEGMREAFTDFSATVDEIVAGGDMVAMWVTLRGTHDGAFMGLEPTGEDFEIANVVFTSLEEGLITERRLLTDMFSFFQQLGVEDLSVLELPTA